MSFFHLSQFQVSERFPEIPKFCSWMEKMQLDQTRKEEEEENDEKEEEEMHFHRKR